MLARSIPQRAFHSVLIIDDHPLFCDALSMTLKAVANIEEVHMAPNLENALQTLADGLAPDAIVLDLNLPDVDGLDGLIRMKTTTSLPIVVVSSLSDIRVINQVIRAGASGFVPKHSQRDVFRTAFDTLRSGAIYVPDTCVLQEGEDDGHEDDVIRRLSTLTNQQSRILQLICEGKLNKQIAYDLSIAETTVKAHVTAIMRKLEVQSRTQAVLIAKQVAFDNFLRS